MHAAVSPAPSSRVPRWVVPIALLAVSVLSVGAVFWGSLVAKPNIRVFEFDAGPVEGLEIGSVRPFDELGLYLVGLADGRVRALDGRVRSSGCLVRYQPDDERGREANPRGVAGTFEDPCTGAYWAINGNQIHAAGKIEPLRTFEIAFVTKPGQTQHIFVEVLGRDRPPTATPN
ncbi:MAG: hypothetical protein U0360_02215 [Dehalococcoidia bacterium]